MSAVTAGTSTPSGSSPPPLEEASRLYRHAESLAQHPDPNRHLEALKAFLAYVEAHRKPLEAEAAETSGRLDRVGMSFYRVSETELAARAIDLGLTFTPGSSSLQHHRAMVLLALNRSLDQVLPLLENALAGNPHDKQIWATRGDALRLLDRPAEAAEAYLKAQQLDATSTQYVDRALKVAPNHPTALRMKLQLARAHGGDRQALEACEALLQATPDDGGLLIARAELLTGLGEVPAALEALSRAEKARPEDPKVHLLRGRLWMAAGKHEEAAAQFTELLRTDANLDAVALGEMADVLEQSGAIDSAIEARRRIQALEPRNLGNLSALRGLATTSGKFEIALAACQAILDASPENLEAMRSVAELHAQAGKVDDAIEAYRSLLKAHPHEPGEARRAVAYARSVGAIPILIEFARVALAEDANDPTTQEEVAHALNVLGDKEGALSALDVLIQQRPSDPALLAEKKQLLTELGRTDELPEVFDELFRLDPTRSDLALDRGHIYLSRAFDQPENSPERERSAREALVSYERASLDGALSSRSMLGVARASRLVRDHERSIKAYREFLASAGNEQRADVMKELGHAFREVGRLSEAESVYAQAVQLGLEDADLFWAESEVLSLLNQEDKALRLIDLLLEREPANPLFQRRKGALLLKAGRRTEALQILKSAVSGSSGDPHVHFEVAEALRATGVYADAIAFFRTGLEIDPKNRPARLALAETLALAGRDNEAVPLLDTLLREDPNDVSSWRARADAYRRLERPNDLLYSLKAILLLDPHNAPALLEKYRLHLERSEATEAYECLTMLLDSGGPQASDPELLIEHGDLSARLGQTEPANRSFERAAQLDPARAPDIAARRARLRLSAGRPDLALEVLEAALAALPAEVPPTPEALLLKAEILTALERPAEAQGVYQEARQRDPASTRAIGGLARALLDQGKPADAKALLNDVLGQVAPESTLYLLLAEAEAGLGQLPDAIAVVQKGVELLPKSAPLWIRLGELFIAKELWADAASALAHAISLQPTEVMLVLRAGFVSERLGHPNEALALYDRATQIAPADKSAWCSRGIALLSTGRPEDALQSFERSLALDSDFEAAKEGKKAALEKTRERQVEVYGREALLLEAKLQRTVTKNDLFVTLHVPFDQLEPVLDSLAKDPRIDLSRLSESELHDLESSSYHLISAALEHRPEGIERRGFTLADVAVLSPPTTSLGQIQRVFGYLRSVLEADLRPENLKLTPDVEELARRALLLPESQRTLFQIVRTLRVGLFKARLIKAVESAGATGHAAVPGLDLGRYSPEFRGADRSAAAGAVAPAGRPAAVAAGTSPRSPPASHGSPTMAAPVAASGPTLRCVGCGGIASLVHECGAPLCQHCIAQFHTCPKCGRAITTTSSRALHPPPAPMAPPHPTEHEHPPAPHASKPAAAKPKPVPPRPPTATKPVHPAERPHPHGAEPAQDDEEPEAAAPPTPRPPRPREKGDDEPRL